MFKKLFLAFTLSIIFTCGFISADPLNKAFFVESKNNFENTAKLALKTNDLESLKVYLVTISPGITLSTAFGHSALRLQFGNEYDEQDFYIDFGQYDESVSFLWKFLRGNAGFYFSVVPTTSAYNAWDASGRGFLVSEFKMDSKTKEKFLKEVLKLFESVDGYEYNNFKSNCVTFIRDLISNVYNTKLELTTSANQNTWRKRVLRFSDKIIWLRIQEKLLFDHDADKERFSSELIYLPLDLQISVEDSKLVKETKELIPNRWKVQSGTDIVGLFGFIIFIFTVITQFPKGILFTYQRYGQFVYSFLSGLGGSLALLVFIITSFDFMDENLVVLVFTPLDFLLLKKNISNHKHYIKYILLRMLMLAIAFVLRMTIFKQNIDFILFFSTLFFAFLLINSFYKRSLNLES